jgi:hypothetical protein
MSKSRVSGAVFLSMMQRQMEDETLESSVKAINDILKTRLQTAQRERKRKVEGHDYVEDVEYLQIKLDALAEALDIDLDEEE